MKVSLDRNAATLQEVQYHPPMSPPPPNVVSVSEPEAQVATLSSDMADNLLSSIARYFSVGK